MESKEKEAYGERFLREGWRERKGEVKRSKRVEIKRRHKGDYILLA